MPGETLPVEVARRTRGGWLVRLRFVAGVLVRLPRSVAALLVVGWMALIWALSSSTRLVDGGLLGEPLLGNLAHAPAFGLLALWALLLAPRRGARLTLPPRALGLVLGFVLAYAIVDELHQGFVAGRHPSAFDLLTDAAGALAVVWTASYVNSPRALEAGVRLRLLLGCLACVAAAALATAGGAAGVDPALAGPP